MPQWLRRDSNFFYASFECSFTPPSIVNGTLFFICHEMKFKKKNQNFIIRFNRLSYANLFFTSAIRFLLFQQICDYYVLENKQENNEIKFTHTRIHIIKKKKMRCSHTGSCKRYHVRIYELEKIIKHVNSQQSTVSNEKR